MPLMSEITVTPDMMRRRLVDRVPFGARDVFGMLAAALCGTGLCSWGIVLFSKSLGGWQ